MRRQNIMSRKYSVLIGLLLTSPALTAFSSPLQAQQRPGIPLWVWALVVLVLLVIAVWWLYQTGTEEKVSPAPVAKPQAPAPAPAPPAAEPTADDLKRIEGIGPKISSLLQAAGVLTFAQLAETDVSRLKEILDEAGLGALADPSTWPQQARLAAEGQWGTLQALQDELKGGRAS
jgi:predicted flap endonuclease-1-like 5' DNA nuclease